MKKKVIKGLHDWPEQAIKDLHRISEDIEAIIDGENQIIVMNILVNLFLQACVRENTPKGEIMKILSEAYDVILKHKQVENEYKYT